MNLGQILKRNAEKFPNKTGLKYQGLEISFRELNERVNAVANTLAELGVRKGDRVAILAQNCPEYIESYFATAKIGAVAVPLNFRLAEKEIDYIVGNAEASALILEHQYMPVTRLVRENRPKMISIVIGKEIAGCQSYHKIISDGETKEPEVEIDQGDLAIIMYTSGTTGLPKGAMLTHKSIIANTINQVITERVREVDKILICTPLYHIAATAPLLSHYYMGCTAVVLREFTPVSVLEGIQNEKVTYILLVPAMINFILQVPNLRDYDLSSLELVTYGAAPISLGTIKDAMAKFGCAFMQYFGQTEASPILTRLPYEDHLPRSPEDKMERLNSAGKAMINVEVKIFDQDDGEVAPGIVGEIVARGDILMKGYWKIPEATEKTLRGGWLHTGDLGMTDEEGYIYIVDRAKDMIISGAENIFPAEVEKVINDHPKVLESAVYGIPDEQWGESVKAVVVLKPGATATAQEVIEHCKSNLASYKKPKVVEFMDAIPRNASGKILKTVLREREWEGRKRRVN